MNLRELEERGLSMKAPRVLPKNYFLVTRPFKIELITVQVCYVYFQKMNVLQFCLFISTIPKNDGPINVPMNVRELEERG